MEIRCLAVLVSTAIGWYKIRGGCLKSSKTCTFPPNPKTHQKTWTFPSNSPGCLLWSNESKVRWNVAVLMWRPVLPIVQTWYQQITQKKRMRSVEQKIWLKLSALPSYVSGLEMMKKKHGMTLKKVLKNNSFAQRCNTNIHHVSLYILMSMLVSYIRYCYIDIRLSRIDTYFHSHSVNIGMKVFTQKFLKASKSDKQQVKNLSFDT